MIPTLSICIINHCTPELTRGCLQSLYRTTGDLPIEIFVVNNTREPCDLSDLAAQRSTPLRLIQNEQPLGFAANQNQMMRLAQGRYLMPLNSDTVAHPGALPELVRFMDAHPRCGIAGPRLVYADGALQPSCRNFPSAVPTFFEVSGLWTRFRGNRVLGRWILLCNPHTDVIEAEWLHGACYIVRRTAAEQVGYYDADRFIMFGEDVEWCWRMRQAGWQILFNPNAVVTHLEGQSPLDDRAVQMYRGGMRFVRKHYSPLRFLPVRISAVMALVIRWLLARNPQTRRVCWAAMKTLVAGHD